MLDKIPIYAIEAVFGLIKAIHKLAVADTEEEREDALMTAAEVAKAALDKKKFG